MKVLGIDSSTMTLSIALIENDKILFESNIHQMKSMSERLQPTLVELLAEQDITMDKIDLYGVSVGPGSFTGLRIGITAVKIFGRVFNKPVCGISTMRTMAYGAKGNAVIAPMLDARRDRCYTGIYSYDGDILKTIEKDDVIELETALNRCIQYKKVLITGDIWNDYSELIYSKLGDRAIKGNAGDSFPRGSSVASLALEDYSNGIFTNPYELLPEYLRPSQAERELGEKNVST